MIPCHKIKSFSLFILSLKLRGIMVRKLGELHVSNKNTNFAAQTNRDIVLCILVNSRARDLDRLFIFCNFVAQLRVRRCWDQPIHKINCL